MTRVLTIAAREIRERSFVFIAAAIMAVIPFAAALLPYARISGRTAVISTGALIVSIGFTFALALVLGGSMVGRELSERRLSFYFSKPVAPSAVWFGKLVAALMTVWLCFGIIFLPSYLVARSFWRPNFSGSLGGFIFALLAAAAVLLLLAHAGSTMVRSRSTRVALDLLLLCATDSAIWLILRPLFAVLAHRLAGNVGQFISWGLFVTLVLAGAWQLSRGRTDIRRSHAELSKFLWSASALVIAAAALFVTWVFSAGPRDIDIKVAWQNPRGDWAMVRGPARHRGDYEGIFLVNLVNGKSMRFEPGRFEGCSFTRRGDAMVAIAPLAPNANWRSSEDRYGRSELYVQRLDAPQSDGDTGIQTQSSWASVAISDDLSRAAIYERGLLSVHDLSRKSLLGSVRLPQGALQMFFVSPDVVRVYSSDKPDMAKPPVATHVYEFDVRTRRLEHTGELQPFGFPVDVSPDGATVVVRSQGTLVVADARTLAQRFTIAGNARTAILLDSGGVASLDVSNGNASLRVFDARGAEVRNIALERGKWGGVREIVPGKKLLAIVWPGGWDESRARGWNLDVIDVERGVIERQDRNLVIGSQFHGLADPRHPDMMATPEFLVTDASGTLWRWNALTGAKKKLFA